MTDYATSEKMDLSIDFGNKIYSDSEFTIYEALNTADSSKLLVLVVTGARVKNASLEIAKEIRSACEHINSITSSSNGLYPIIDSGVMPDLQPFFVSAFPNGKPLGDKRFTSPEELIDVVELLRDKLSILHNKGLTQGGFNIRAEWYYSDDRLCLIFPGLRGILRRILDEGTLAPVQERRATGAFMFMNAVLTPERDVRNLCDLLAYWADNALREEVNETSPDLKKGYKLLKNVAESYCEDGNSEDFDLATFGKFLGQLKIDLNYIEDWSGEREVLHSDRAAENPLPEEELFPFDGLIKDLEKYKGQNPPTNNLMSNSEQDGLDDDSSQSDLPDSVLSDSFSRAAKEVFGDNAIEISGERRPWKKFLKVKYILILVLLISSVFFLVEYLSKSEIESSRVNDVDAYERPDKVSSMTANDEREIAEQIHRQEEEIKDSDTKQVHPESDKNLAPEIAAEVSSLNQDKLFLDTLPTPLSKTDIEQVFEFLNSEDFELRIAAVRVLGEKAPRNVARVHRAIELMLGDEDALVRGFAAFSLVAYSGEAALPALKSQLSREKSEVVSAAINRAIKRLN